MIADGPLSTHAAPTIEVTLLGRCLRLATRMLAIVGALAFLVTLTPVANVLARPLLAVPSALGRADVIVVLSGGRYLDGSLNDASLERTVTAVRLYRLGLGPRLLFSGGPCCGESASALMARLATDLGVPSSIVLLEEVSMRTRESAQHCAALLREQHVRRALLVTSTLHLLRAKLAFEAAGVEVLPVRASETDLSLVSSSAERISLLKDALHEYLGLALYRFRGWIG